MVPLNEWGGTGVKMLHTIDWIAPDGARMTTTSVGDTTAGSDTPTGTEPTGGGNSMSASGTSTGADTVVDTDEHLVEIVLGADPEAADDLRRRALAPLQGLRPATADRLTETLRSWLLHQGHRAAIAADLIVHAQTVRYRIGQLRDLFGERLDDPQTILELTVALGLTPAQRFGVAPDED